MQEHIYRATKKSIFRKSFLIWFFVAVHVAVNVLMILSLSQKGNAWGILFVNGTLSVISIPSLIIFFNYYKYAANKILTITYNSLKFTDKKTGESIELMNADIDKIYLVTNRSLSRFPWIFYDYFYLVDTHQNKIIINCYLIDIRHFWLDTLTRKINSDKLTRRESYYPLI